MNQVNEKKLWDKLDENSKSYTVKVLNFFHYRRNRIGQSWKREEVITWELIRAIDILPRKYFLQGLLEYIKNNKKELALASGKLLANVDEVDVVSYPKLNLPGNKRNSASDVQLSSNNSVLWIEAKTVVIKEDDLGKQIMTQTTALEKMYGGKSFGVIALILEGQKCNKVSIYWSDLRKIFEKALYAMQKDYKNDDKLIRGYTLIAEELINRISVRFQ